MQHCSKCGQTYDSEICPFCGNSAQVSAAVGLESDKSLDKFACLLIAGVVGVSLANGVYKLLDEDTLLSATLALFLGSCGIVLWLSWACSPMPWHLLFVKRMFAFVVVTFFLSSAFVILNGALDHYPPVQAETRVVRTYRTGGGRYSDNSFHIVVSPSWRHGRNQEDFQPIGDYDGNLRAGDFIRVEVHRGALWLPWGPTVTDRMRCPSGVYGPSMC